MIKVDVGNVTEFPLTDLLPGVTYFFYVTAHNTAGLESEPSEQITHTVPAPNLPPVVAIAQPLSGSFGYAPAAVSLTALASDADGSVACVEYFANSVKIGEATTAPFLFVWANVTAGQYVFSAVATDNSGATASSLPVNFAVLNQPLPAQPANFQASALSTQAIALNWSDRAVNESAYRIYRSSNDLDYSEVASLPANATAWQDQGLTANTRYYYAVAAVNLTGESVPAITSALTQTPPAPVTKVPYAPARLVARSDSTCIHLSWYGPPTATSYTIYRSTKVGGPYTVLASGLTTTSYSDSVVEPGGVYYYFAVASNAAGNRANSALLSARTLSQPPAAPNRFIASAVSGGINLQWFASQNASTYTVKRSLSTAGPFTPIATAITSTTFRDTSAPLGSPAITSPPLTTNSAKAQIPLSPPRSSRWCNSAPALTCGRVIKKRTRERPCNFYGSVSRRALVLFRIVVGAVLFGWTDFRDQAFTVIREVHFIRIDASHAVVRAGHIFKAACASGDH